MSNSSKHATCETCSLMPSKTYQKKNKGKKKTPSKYFYMARWSHLELGKRYQERRCTEQRVVELSV